ncbi:MAG: ribonuclease III [Chloroflexi bacterium]|nr:ribonuclease III [Chloroflexota bacterium]
MTTEVSHLEASLGLLFRDRRLLRCALVHSSYVNEHPELAEGSNERLEFLGDALLDFVVAEELFRRYPEKPEGELTALRAALVCGESLARVGDALKLGDFLCLGQGEEASGGRSRPSNLAAALESVVGAILLDQGVGAARDFVLRVLGGELERLPLLGAPKDPKSLLQELVQSRGQPSPMYRMVGEEGPDHAKQFVMEAVVEGEILGRGRGRRKAEAERAAAQAALEHLREGLLAKEDDA